MTPTISDLSFSWDNPKPAILFTEPMPDSFEQVTSGNAAKHRLSHNRGGTMAISSVSYSVRQGGSDCVFSAKIGDQVWAKLGPDFDVPAFQADIDELLLVAHDVRLNAPVVYAHLGNFTDPVDEQLQDAYRIIYGVRPHSPSSSTESDENDARIAQFATRMQPSISTHALRCPEIRLNEYAQTAQLGLIDFPADPRYATGGDVLVVKTSDGTALPVADLHLADLTRIHACVVRSAVGSDEQVPPFQRQFAVGDRVVWLPQHGSGQASMVEHGRITALKFYNRHRLGRTDDAVYNGPVVHADLHFVNAADGEIKQRVPNSKSWKRLTGKSAAEKSKTPLTTSESLARLYPYSDLGVLGAEGPTASSVLDNDFAAVVAALPPLASDSAAPSHSPHYPSYVRLYFRQRAKLL